MTPIQILRDAAARREALAALARAHDHFSNEEQVMAGEGRIAEAEGAHTFALIALRAYRAEMDDPEPAAPHSATCNDPRCSYCGWADA